MDGSVETLTDHLHALKAQGAALLILNPPSTHPQCLTLLGDDGEQRRRLFVTTNGRSEAFTRTVGRTTDPAVTRHLAVAPETTRTAAAASAGPSASIAGASESPDVTPTWRTRVDDPADLAAVAHGVHEHLDAFEEREPAPGEIRLCFDSLDTLVDAVDRDELFRFLHALTNRVRARRGLGHFHLSATVDDAVDHLRPLFEAVVEQRRTPAGLAQRWRFRDADLETDWLPVESN